jgi:hypothetical protein
MSFGVALNRCSAFEDWDARGRPADAMFKYMEYHNQGNEVLVYIFIPGQGMLYMELYVDFEIKHIKVYAGLSFDEDERVVHVTSIFCERENYWDEKPEDGNESGGLALYLKNQEEYGDAISIEVFVRRFFSADWKVNKVGDGRKWLPEVDERYFGLLEEYLSMGGWRLNCTWDRVVGLYFVSEREQKRKQEARGRAAIKRFLKGAGDARTAIDYWSMPPCG